MKIDQQPQGGKATGWSPPKQRRRGRWGVWLKPGAAGAPLCAFAFRVGCKSSGSRASVFPSIKWSHIAS